MKNKKGFTLIELLAVIVILAIIALIATPIVLNMINSARKSAAKSAALGYIDAIEYYTGFNQLNDNLNITGYDVNAPVGECKKENGAWNSTECTTFYNEVDKKTKGKKPDKASIILDANGKVLSNSVLEFNGYEIVYDGKDTEYSICKEETLEETIFNFDKNTGKIVAINISGQYTSDVLEIPCKIDGVEVKSVEGISKDALYGRNSNRKLTKLVLPNTLKEISGGTFSNHNLTSINLPYGIEKIDSCAFCNNNISYVYIPGSIKYIDPNQFGNNPLKTVVLGEGVEEISPGAFYSNNEIEKLYLPNSLKIINGGAFQNSNLSSLTIPSNVETIGSYSFANNANLKTIINKTGKSFDWNNILGVSSPSDNLFETGSVETSHGTVTITN